MSVETSKKVLKIAGILSIIGGIFWVIGVIALANGGWSDFVEWNF